MIGIEELRSKFLDLEFDRSRFIIDAEQSVAVAKAYGEVRAEFTDPCHPDWQACISILASLASGRRLPIDFPSVGGISMDGGKAVTCIKPVRLGIQLTGRTHLHDIYAKSGRSGRIVNAAVTNIDEDEGQVMLDLTIKNDKDETRVFGTATVTIPGQ